MEKIKTTVIANISMKNMVYYRQRFELKKARTEKIITANDGNRVNRLSTNIQYSHASMQARNCPRQQPASEKPAHLGIAFGNDRKSNPDRGSTSCNLSILANFGQKCHYLTQSSRRRSLQTAKPLRSNGSFGLPLPTRQNRGLKERRDR